MNRNFNNQSIVTDDTLVLIQQNNASILQKTNIFTAKQTFDEIAMNKITITPAGNSISIGSLFSTPINSTSVGVASIAGPTGVTIGFNSQGLKSNNIVIGANSSTNADTSIIIGNSSGHFGSSSGSNIYLGHSVSHASNTTYSNSVAIGHSSVISANNTIFLGTSSQFQQLYRPIISNHPILNYITYPTLLATQIGFVRSSVITSVFTSTLDSYQNLSNIILPIGCYSIVYQLTIIPTSITTGIDKFLCNVSLADSITNTIPFQTNLIPCRIDNTLLNVNLNTNYSNSLIVSNSTLVDKIYFLNMLFITSEMATINPNKYTYTIKIDATRLSKN